MRHRIPHDLGLDLARRTCEVALARYAERYARYEPTLTWEGPDVGVVSFVARGLRLQATVHIYPDAIEVAAEVPLLLRPFRRRAEEIIDREVNKWIARARAGEIS